MCMSTFFHKYVGVGTHGHCLRSCGRRGVVLPIGCPGCAAQILNWEEQDKWLHSRARGVEMTRGGF